MPESPLSPRGQFRVAIVSISRVIVLVSKEGFQTELSMLFADALRSGLFGLFRYHGRADRFEHWVFAFFTGLFAGGFWLAFSNGIHPGGYGLLLILVFGIWLFLSNVALFVRRLHDHGRTGLFLLIPFLGSGLMLIGHLGEHGYVHHLQAIMEQYGWWIRRAGQSVLTISATMLFAVFAGPGTPKENRFGDPVE